ncbi:cyclic GMP-AMP synthase-like [Hyposmocoma kahamanoa]|uniref:cyclic GMP-AMP synthase-like n=1 Tax=Hyposmocoma kahamanoa TaxID=1477025 RepID=UPI000E6D7C36|nr:cyclic GMP-AMP synthase-like [Hyposmocoma kahamanoa]
MKSHISQRKKKTLEDVYQEINRDNIRLDKEATKKNNAILYSVLQKILTLIRKKCVDFDRMKPKLEYLGSYYDGLRVGEPTEYDINVVLKLPVQYKNIYLDATHVTSYDQTIIFIPAEYTLIKSVPVSYTKSKWCDNKCRISATIFRSWIQGLVDIVLSSLPSKNGRRILSVDNKTYLIYTKMSGPAQTIKIQTGDDESNVIDVDLVPTFSFMLPTKPIGSKIKFGHVEDTNLMQYFVVPKPSDNDFCWRLAFPFQERYYIKNKNNLKSAAKLLKLLRDVQDFKLLASYYIKTLFLWEVKQQPEDFWKENSLSYIVLHMLKRLRDCLSKAEIPNFWCPEFNLLKDKIKTCTCQNWSNRLSAIIKDIEEKGEHDPNVILRYFKYPTEQQSH